MKRNTIYLILFSLGVFVVACDSENRGRLAGPVLTSTDNDTETSGDSINTGTDSSYTYNGGDTTTDTVFTIDDTAEDILADIPGRLALLSEDTIDWWLSNGVDTVNGGFYGTLDEQGNPVGPTDKGVIQQSRQLYAVSLWASLRGRIGEMKPVADDTYNFIVEHFLNADGLFVFKTGETGNVVDSKIKIYAQAFAIYGLATYGRIFEVDAALETALVCFEELDKRFHNDTYGCYDQTNDGDSWINGAARGTNTHIHIMEALTALYDATGNDRVKTRLNELIDATVTYLLQPENYVHQQFLLDWTPTGEVKVSYGHDLETAWLLMDAARSTGRIDDANIRNAAVRMGTYSSGAGFDSTGGGYFDSGVPGGAVSNTDKIWWVQFEALSGLWWTYVLTKDPVHLERLRSTLDYIESVHDDVYGEWFWGHNIDGSVDSRGTNKGEEWKAAYHNIRAMVQVEDWIRSAL